MTPRDELPLRSGQRDPLELEIEAALAVEPSPEFLAKVRAHVADEAESRRAPLYGAPWLRRWAFMGAGATAAAVVAVLLVTGDDNTTTTVSRRPAAPAAATVAVAPPVEVPVAPPVVVPPRASRPTRPAARRKSEPEILIAANEAAAIRRLIFGVRQGRVEMPELTTPAPDATPLSPVSQIAIQPVLIEPLTSSTGEQGVRQ